MESKFADEGNEFFKSNILTEEGILMKAKEVPIGTISQKTGLKKVAKDKWAPVEKKDKDSNLGKEIVSSLKEGEDVDEYFEREYKFIGDFITSAKDSQELNKLKKIAMKRCDEYPRTWKEGVVKYFVDKVKIKFRLSESVREKEAGFSKEAREKMILQIRDSSGRARARKLI